MAQGMIRIDASDFVRKARYYGELGKGLVGEELMKNLVEENATYMVTAAKKYLNQFVYDVPSTSHYVRTHVLYNSIKQNKAELIPSGAKAQAYIDPSDYPTHVYAGFVNYGTVHMKARPFWTMAETETRAQASVIGRKYLTLFRERIASGR